jgi:hypothetical protein
VTQLTVRRRVRDAATTRRTRAAPAARHVPRDTCNLAGEEDMVGYGGIWGI